MLISAVSFDELAEAPDDVQRVLRNLPAKSVIEVPVVEEVKELTAAYLEAGVLTAASTDDAIHVAAATVWDADLILSWNFRHIVNYGRIRAFNSVNLAQGYRPIDIRSPLEVGYDDQDEDV